MTDLAAIRARHVHIRDDVGDLCRDDQQGWPCDAAVLLTANAALRAALRWALDTLSPYSHPASCRPGECVCGYADALAALADVAGEVGE